MLGRLLLTVQILSSLLLAPPPALLLRHCNWDIQLVYSDDSGSLNPYLVYLEKALNSFYWLQDVLWLDKRRSCGLLAPCPITKCPACRLAIKAFWVVSGLADKPHTLLFHLALKDKWAHWSVEMIRRQEWDGKVPGIVRVVRVHPWQKGSGDCCRFVHLLGVPGGSFSLSDNREWSIQITSVGLDWQVRHLMVVQNTKRSLRSHVHALPGSMDTGTN